MDPIFPLLLLATSPSSVPASGFGEVWPRLALTGVVLWLSASFVVSWDWRRFAGRYPATTRPAGRAHTAVKATMGWSPVSPYKNVVRVILTEEGVYFCVWFPFRLCHPPFLLPWESVRRVEKKDSFLLGQSIHVDVMDPVGTMHLWLRKSVEQDLLKYFLALREPVRPVENV